MSDTGLDFALDHLRRTLKHKIMAIQEARREIEDREKQAKRWREELEKMLDEQASLSDAIFRLDPKEQTHAAA